MHESGWHSVPLAQVEAELQSSPAGLTEGEARQRIARFGPNELPRRAATPLWRIFARQFAGPLILVLAFATLLSVLVGDLRDAAFIAVVLLLNAAVGCFQEARAERSTRALEQMLRFRTEVERDGQVRQIDAREVVPGDVLWLESGARVPADARLCQSNGLQVDESLLTGESRPVHKDAGWTGPPETPQVERRNMLYAGATIVGGRAKALVIATGRDSAVGRLAIDVLAAPPGRSPLLVRLDQFGRTIGGAAVAVVVLIAILGVLMHGRGTLEMAFFAIALAVSVIPEGLPVAVTIALAVASTRMAQRGVIVRRLGAVEGLGSCTYIASDKTGTLTCNELTVRELWLADASRFAIEGEGFRGEGRVAPAPDSLDAARAALLGDALRSAVLCNEGGLHNDGGRWKWHGDPTDVALLAMAAKFGVQRERLLDENPEINRIPFEPERRFAASYHAARGEPCVFVKGAPERVLEMCRAAAGAAALDDVRSAAAEMAKRGLRVLGLASGPLRGDVGKSHVPPEPQGLTLLALVGMIDPLRSGAREAVDAARRAGICVALVTGDHPDTALAIARELSLADDPRQVVVGADMADSAAGIAGLVERARVFARVTPHQKLELVEAAQRAGHFVAVTGDGVNDAPALRAANIGVAMGRAGTDVARDAADLVISDDNFATIVGGIEEGRVAYDNIRKVIYLLVSTNAAEVVVAVVSVLAGLPLPLLPVQLLWLNLVTEGIQGLTLAFEPAEEGVLRRPPRAAREPIFNGLMIERIVVGAGVMSVSALASFWFMLRAGWSEEDARNALLLLMVLYENVQLGNCRSETRSALMHSPLRSPWLLGGAVAALLVHLAAMHWPLLGQTLRIGPVSLGTWAALAPLALSVFVAMEIHKLIWRKRASPGEPAR